MDVLYIVNIEKKKQMKISIDKIKRIRKQYGFPMWLIVEAIKYYDGDEDKTVNRLTEIYRAIGDHPDIVIEKNIEKFMDEIQYSKIENKLQEIKRFLDNELHPVVSPDDWWLYSQLVDLIDELEDLIIDDKRSMNNEYNIDITAETKRI